VDTHEFLRPGLSAVVQVPVTECPAHAICASLCPRVAGCRQLEAADATTTVLMYCSQRLSALEDQQPELSGMQSVDRPALGV
jgi:hypothetical protein